MDTQPGAPKCGAQRRHEAGICRRPAGAGTSHRGTGRCSWHGGCAPSGEKAAAQEEAYEQARRQLARLNVPPVSDPVLALRKLGGQAQWWNETCAENLNRLRAEELRYPSSVRIEQIRAEVQLYTDSMRICHQVLTSLAKIDLDTWAQMLEERKAQLIVGALNAALTRPELPPELSRAVTLDFASRLRGISRAEAAREAEEEDRALTGVLIPPARRPA